MKLLFLTLLFSFTLLPVFAQQDSLTPSQQKQFERQQRRDSIRAKKKIWLSILGGPSYNPEASLGAGGALLMSFRMNKYDSISQRSFIPIGFNMSINGTIVAGGAGTLFFNENRFRTYFKFSFRNEPTNFYGVGFDEIKYAQDLKDEFGEDSIVKVHRTTFVLNPKFVWEIRRHMYAGAIFDINFNKTKDITPFMAGTAAFNKFGAKYTNLGLGATLEYDSRDDVATPFKGMLLSLTGMVYGKYIGGDNNYELLTFEYRHFRQIFRPRSTLAWTAKSQIGMDNVPYSELPAFGSSSDLRGYIQGKYRDKSMAYGIVEYRHMFMSQEAYERGAFWSKFGAVAWVGTATLGNKPEDWSTWKYNYGVGLRIQIQPRKNFRLDIGREPGQKWGIYMNMTEAF